MRIQQVKREIRLVKVRKGRLKTTEPSEHGSSKYVVDAPPVCYLCGGQHRGGVYTLGTGGL